MAEESPEQLISVYLENSMALQAMGLDVGLSDFFIWVHIIGKKLDKVTRRQYSKGDEIESFLEQRARALESSMTAKNVLSNGK